MSSRPRAADDFSPIRERLLELQRERDAIEEQKAKAAQADAMEAAAQSLAECEAETPAAPVDPVALAIMRSNLRAASGFLPPGFHAIRREYADGSVQHFFSHDGKWHGPYWTKTQMIVAALRVQAIQLTDLRLLWRPDS